MIWEMLTSLSPTHVMGLIDEGILDIIALLCYAAPIVALVIWGFCSAIGKRRITLYAVGGMILALALTIVLLPEQYIDMSPAKLITPSEDAVARFSALESPIEVRIMANASERDSLLFAALQTLARRTGKVRYAPPEYISSATFHDVNSLRVYREEAFVVVPYRRLLLNNPAAQSGQPNLLLNLESELLQAAELLAHDVPRIYRVSGPVDEEYPTVLVGAMRVLTQEPIEAIELTQPVPMECDLLVIDDPRTDLDASQSAYLMAYLRRGGKLLLLTDYAYGAMPGLGAALFETGLSAIDGVVLDPGGAMGGAVQYPMPTPSDGHVVGRWMSAGKRMPLLSLSHAIAMQGEGTSPILMSTKDAYLQLNDLEHASLASGEEDLSGSFALAASSEMSGGKVVWIASADMMSIISDADVGGANEALILACMRYLLDVQVEPILAKILTVAP